MFVVTWFVRACIVMFSLALGTMMVEANSFNSHLPNYAQFIESRTLIVGEWDSFSTSWACTNYEDARAFFFAYARDEDHGASIARDIFVDGSEMSDSFEGCEMISLLQHVAARVEDHFGVVFLATRSNPKERFFETLISFCLKDEKPCRKLWYAPVLNHVMTGEEKVAANAGSVSSALEVIKEPKTP